jgi:hypothetical protein
MLLQAGALLVRAYVVRACAFQRASGPATYAMQSCNPAGRDRCRTYPWKLVSPPGVYVYTPGSPPVLSSRRGHAKVVWEGPKRCPRRGQPYTRLRAVLRTYPREKREGAVLQAVRRHPRGSETTETGYATS